MVEPKGEDAHTMRELACDKHMTGLMASVAMFGASFILGCAVYVGFFSVAPERPEEALVLLPFAAYLLWITYFCAREYHGTRERERAIAKRIEAEEMKKGNNNEGGARRSPEAWGAS